MGVDRDNLSDSASIGVTAVILVSVTIMTLYMIVNFQMNLKYLAVKRLVIILFLMPIFIGWVAWSELLLGKRERSMEFLINLFKAICVASFMLYIERMLGWVQDGESNRYSEERKYQVLLEGKTHTFLCRKAYPVKSIEEAKTFLFRIRIAVLQSCVLLVTLGIIGFAMVIATGNYELTDPTQNKIIEIFSITKTVSAVISLIALIKLIFYARRIPDMQHFDFVHKFVIIKLGILFTEIQPLIIQAFANKGLIASTSKYSTATITSYTNSLMVVSEMIIMSFLLLLVFPIADYEIHPELRGRFVQEVEALKKKIST